MKKTWFKRLAVTVTAALLALTVLAGCSSNNIYRNYGAADYNRQFAAPVKGDTMAKFTTSMGEIVVKLFPKEAPKAVENFTTHAKEGYYDGMTFHRVISDFMVQTGDPTGTGYGGESIWGGPFDDELISYLSPYYGALCMANRGANTNGSQFFFVTMTDKDIEVYRRLNMDVEDRYKVADAKIAKWAEVGGAIYLDYQMQNLKKQTYPNAYTVYYHTTFGQVVEGMDVVEAISRVRTYGDKEVTEAQIKYGKDQTEVVKDKPVEDVIVEHIEIYTYGG